MLAENGWRFLLVDGACGAWLLTDFTQPLRTLTLSSDQERRLWTALQLSDWTPFEGESAGGCADAPRITYRFLADLLYVPVCGLAPTDPLAKLNAAFDAQLNDLAATATATSGDLRYLVVAGSQPVPGDDRATVAWPLDVPIESTALSEEYRYIPGTARRATGGDADRLRAIRVSGGSAYTFGFTPIAGSSDIFYRLFIRDALPFE